jgi:hypothetical protein
MPLLDHFHAPVYPRRPWESFHAVWATTILEYLNQVLPPRYFAAVHIHLGQRIEADVVEFDQLADDKTTNGPAGNLALATWAPPAATLAVPAVFPDDIEVQIIDTRDDAVVVGVIELISPGNKDRPDARRAFAAKCSAYLQRGIGLIIIDVVTMRPASLHAELLGLLGWTGDCGLPSDAKLYAVAYWPTRREGNNLIEIWTAPLVVGDNLPTLPLALRGGRFVPVELETTYSEARQRSRL